MSYDGSLLTGAQLKAARALLGLHVDDLAQLTKLGPATIRRAEGEMGKVRLTAANAERIIGALEAKGIEFISSGGVVGVQLRNR